MKIAVLTSSRADYGIYLPLLKGLKKDPRYDLNIIAFGTHLKKNFGYTIDQIVNDGFEIAYKIDNLLEGDSPKDISDSYANTILKFSDFWSKNNDFDWVLCLGDRFEMAAAVNAGIPFQIKFAHIHAGETTLGAIDNIYRHQITLASSLHFVSLSEYADKVQQLIGHKETTEIIGSLSLLNLESLNLLSIDDFREKWNIDLNLPTILVTAHPETVQFNENEKYAIELKKALIDLAENYQIVVTLPNADTNGAIFRKMFFELGSQYVTVKLIENFGTLSYFSCMKWAKLLIGNTSSGIIEAASFNKYVINLGNRQAGRIAPENVLNVPFDSKKITETAEKYIQNTYFGNNPYFQKNSIEMILERLITNALNIKL